MVGTSKGDGVLMWLKFCDVGAVYDLNASSEAVPVK